MSASKTLIRSNVPCHHPPSLPSIIHLALDSKRILNASQWLTKLDIASATLLAPMAPDWLLGGCLTSISLDGESATVKVFKGPTVLGDAAVEKDDFHKGFGERQAFCWIWNLI